LRFWERSVPIPKWLLIVPLVWLGWQFVSATQSVDRSLTAATLRHFVSCVIAFYVGLFALSRVTRLRAFWLGLVGGFVVVMIIGWKQHFGGLEETRRYFHSLPDWQSYPVELLKKISSDRIYATLFYPNTLAGVVLLVLPVSIVMAWQGSRSFPPRMRMCVAGIVGVLGVGSLYWCGSKGGWLIATGQTALALARAPLTRKTKVTVLLMALCGALGVFWLKYQDYFGRGAISVTARFDYWEAAYRTLAAKPVFGSGPGTFMVSYKALKPPEAEMTRLAHNDYLQQGSDSGWIGLLGFGLWILGGIWILYRRCSIDLTHFSVFVGLLGIMAQGFMEFGLYVPAIFWPFMMLLGWLLGVTEPRNQMDKPSANS
jgi:O-antigen ligase